MKSKKRPSKKNQNISNGVTARPTKISEVTANGNVNSRRGSKSKAASSTNKKSVNKRSVISKPKGEAKLNRQNGESLKASRSADTRKRNATNLSKTGKAVTPSKKAKVVAVPSKTMKQNKVVQKRKATGKKTSSKKPKAYGTLNILESNLNVSDQSSQVM